MRLLPTLLLAAPLLLCGFGPPRVVDRPLGTFEVTARELREIDSARVGELSARAGFVMDFATGQTLFASHADMRLAPASTTKMMTALLVIQNHRLTEMVPVDGLAANEPGTRMGLTAGDRLSVRELLYGLLLPSGNDAAIAFAVYDGGSIAGFVSKMNSQAAALQMDNTHFANPDGLDDPRHYSSARDLATLARYNLRSQPLFDRLVQTKSMFLPATSSHGAFNLENLNQLLGTYLGADGVKTGTTPEAGESLVASATRSGHRLLAVVLGSQMRYVDARKLLDFGFDHLVWLRPDLFLPYELPVLVRDVGEVPVPRWEFHQVQVFLDQSAETAVFSLMGRTILVAPLWELE